MAKRRMTTRTHDRSGRRLVEMDQRGRIHVRRLLGGHQGPLLAERTADGGLLLHPAVAMTVAEAAEHGYQPVEHKLDKGWPSHDSERRPVQEAVELLKGAGVTITVPLAPRDLASVAHTALTGETRLADWHSPAISAAYRWAQSDREEAEAGEPYSIDLETADRYIASGLPARVLARSKRKGFDPLAKSERRRRWEERRR